MTNARLPLAFIPAGEEIRLTTFGDAIPLLQREQLASYGLIPDCSMKVLQQHPMSVILTDEIELALEHEIARHIWVDRKHHSSDRTAAKTN